MNETVSLLQEKVRNLESQIERELEAHRKKFHYSVTRRRVKFEAAVRTRHKELRVSVFRFLRQSGIMRILSAFVIYIQIVPLVLLDIAVTLFQFICFPIYGIT